MRGRLRPSSAPYPKTPELETWVSINEPVAPRAFSPRQRISRRDSANAVARLREGRGGRGSRTVLGDSCESSETRGPNSEGLVLSLRARHRLEPKRSDGVRTDEKCALLRAEFYACKFSFFCSAKEHVGIRSGFRYRLHRCSLESRRRPGTRRSASIALAPSPKIAETIDLRASVLFPRRRVHAIKGLASSDLAAFISLSARCERLPTFHADVSAFAPADDSTEESTTRLWTDRGSVNL